jgi:hypothetical protein
MTERWAEISGTDGQHWVSDQGNVRGPRGPVRSKPGNTAYLIVKIRRFGAQRTCLVHCLVAEAFIGPRPEGHDVDHIDRNRANPSAVNLRYRPTSENRADRVTTGNAKLTEGQVREIMQLERPVGRGRGGHHHPNSLHEIAKRYGVRHSAVSSIFTGKRWKHLSAKDQSAQPQDVGGER